MNTLLRSTVVFLGATVCVAIASHAQERSLDETLAFINRTLEANSYEDTDGKLTVTSISVIPGGSLVVMISRTKDRTEESTVYEMALEEINLNRIWCRARGDHSDLIVGLRGPAKAQLRCVQPSGTHESALPSEDEVPLALRADPLAIHSIAAAFRTLVRLARADPRYWPG
jgi:hypothetical protein